MAAVVSILHRLLRLLRPTPSSPDRAPSNPLEIPNDVIREILKLLPVKSLMRFKCVSKNWLSIITDPSFTSTFGGGFRGPIVLWPWRAEKRYLMIDYVRIDDTGPIATCEAYHHSTVDQHEGDQILAYTAVVNGLVCFFDGRGNQLWLYNIATRERVRLPVSVSVPPTDKVICNCQLGLGFDPVSKLYKLLKRSVKKDKEDDDGELHPATVYFEILTIGVDSSWRTIDSPRLNSTFGYLGTCTDGVIYGMEFMHTEDCFLTAFHVAEERFQTIQLPRDIFNQPPCFFRWRIRQKGFHPLRLLSFFPAPAPAVVYYGTIGALHVDRYRYGEGEGGRESGGTWETTMLTLHGGIFSPRGILPNGKMLLVDYRGRGPGPDRLVLYNPISRLLEKVLIVKWNGGGTVRSCGTLDPAPGAAGDFYYVEENIVSLKCLISCCN